ncbi:putative laccase-11 [Hordeum vulgare]|nr:putative laccase-11 [Hordeum vulgare]
MVRRLITTYAQLTPERHLQIEAEIRARRATRIDAGLPPDSSKTKEEEEEEDEQQEQPEAMEEEAPGLSMAKAEAEFAVAQPKEMTEQQAILDSIRDEAEVEANRRLIPQRHAKADTLFDEMGEIEAEEAARGDRAAAGGHLSARGHEDR